MMNKFCMYHEQQITFTFQNFAEFILIYQASQVVIQDSPKTLFGKLKICFIAYFHDT